MNPIASTLCVLGIAGGAFGYPIEYAIRFQVIGVSETWNGGNPDDVAELFDFKPAIGDVFLGSLLLEDSVGAVDGDDRMGGLLRLDLELAGLSWNYDIATGKGGALAGFLSTQGLGSVSPSFAFAGGELVGWRGGVYGGADVPFIDFLGTGFRSTDAGLASIHGATTFGKIPMVPEPSTFAYFLLPMAGWLLARLRGWIRP